MKMGAWLSPHFYSDSSSSFFGLPSTIMTISPFTPVFGKMIN